MEITINTHVDDLPAIIRMLQAYCGPTHTSQTVEIAGTPTDELYSGDALKAAIEPEEADVAADEPEAPTPEQAFAAPPTIENYVGQAGGSGGNGQPPKSLFDGPLVTTVQGEVSSASTRHSDAPLPPCDQTEKVGEATGAPRTPHTDVTVDAAGLPWDARIHSGAKSKLANGNWKLLRGVDPDLVASVEAELRGAPKPPVAPPPPAPAPATATPAPAAPSAPPIPPAPATPKPITNAAELVAAVMDKRFTTDQVNAACQAVGVENVASLLAKQDKLPAVLKELGV